MVVAVGLFAPPKGTRAPARILCLQGDTQSPNPFPVAIPSSTRNEFFNPQQEDYIVLELTGWCVLLADRACSSNQAQQHLKGYYLFTYHMSFQNCNRVCSVRGSRGFQQAAILTVRVNPTVTAILAGYSKVTMSMSSNAGFIRSWWVRAAQSSALLASSMWDR